MRRASSAALTPSATGRPIQEYVDAGYNHVYVHQIGPDQDGFSDFYEREVLPAFA